MSTRLPREPPRLRKPVGQSQMETDDFAAPEPGDGEGDAEKRQQHAEDEEGFAIDAASQLTFTPKSR